MSCYSLVSTDLKNRWQRKDFCQACWQKYTTRGSNKKKQQMISHWKTTVAAKNKKALPVDASTIEELFLQLYQAKSNFASSVEKEIYILCLLLVRLRILEKIPGEKDLYRHLENGEKFQVESIKVELAEVEEIKELLIGRLAS